MKKLFKKIWLWLDDRIGLTELLQPLANHPTPPNKLWSYIFGSAALFTFMLQVVTGIALSLLYQPSSEAAYPSLQYITHQAPFGNMLRGIHYYGASAMIIVVGLHMMRTYITASYKFPREMNWISGVFLLMCTIFMGFTGQLLRWDSNGVWSSVVAAEQLGRLPVIGPYLAHLLLGGRTIGGASLSRFFSYHVFIVPAVIFVFIGLHLWLVFKNGISEPPKSGRPVDPKTYRAWYKKYLEKYSVPFWPNAAWRDVMFSSLIILCVICLAIILGAPPLSGRPDPSNITANPTPDWYMVPFFALFALIPHSMESVAMLVGPVLTVMLLLSIPFISNRGERSPLRRPWAMFGVIVVFISVMALLITGLQAPWSPAFKTEQLPVAAITARQPTNQVVTGAGLFYTKGCQYCHKINDYGGAAGPNLSHVGSRLSEQEFIIRIEKGATNMPAYGSILSKQELSDLVAFLQTQK